MKKKDLEIEGVTETERKNVRRSLRERQIEGERGKNEKKRPLRTMRE